MHIDSDENLTEVSLECCFKYNCLFTTCKYFETSKHSIKGLSVHKLSEKLVYLKSSGQFSLCNSLLQQINVYKYDLDLLLTVSISGLFRKRFCNICKETVKLCNCPEWKL